MRNILMISLLLIIGNSCNGHYDFDHDRTGITWGPGAFGSNGERIYFTATSERETNIEASTFEVDGMLLFSGRVACASCHGPDAEGGVHRMGHHTMEAPNIKWSTLSANEHSDSGPETHEHDNAYDLAAFRMAVTDGKHPDGQSLSREMPRWRMPDDDLNDLADFLKSFE